MSIPEFKSPNDVCEALTEDQKLLAFKELAPLLSAEVTRRVNIIGKENIADLFPWFDGTRSSFLEALVTLEDLNEAIQHGNDYM